MPLYEYTCKDCDQVFEVSHGFYENINTCPLCKKQNIKKLISKNSFQLKGTGWYKTDYANKK